MTDKEMIELHGNVILKIIDREWQLTRAELEHAVREAVRNIVGECKAKERLESQN